MPFRDSCETYPKTEWDEDSLGPALYTRAHSG